MLPKPSTVLMRIRHYNLQIFCLGKWWGLEAIFCFTFLVKITGVMVKSNLKTQEKERTTPHNLTVSSEIWGYFAVWEHRINIYSFYLFYLLPLCSD